MGREKSEFFSLPETGNGWRRYSGGRSHTISALIIFKFSLYVYPL